MPYSLAYINTTVLKMPVRCKTVNGNYSNQRCRKLAQDKHKIKSMIEDESVASYTSEQNITSSI
jgi:hypothetical protein